MVKKKNPFVFLDVSIDGDPYERMVFELFFDLVPKTAENFRALCTGEKGVGPKLRKPLHYKGTFFHRIVKGFMAQGGDLLRQEGSAGESIYGDKFPEESSKLKHDEPGLLSMAVADLDTRGSVFNIIFKPNQNLDRKNIVLGKLVHGLEVLKKIEDVGDEDGRPVVTVKICNSGEFSESERKKLGKLAKKADLVGHDTRRKGKHKKSSRDRRKRKRKYYTSESDDSSDSDSDSSDLDTDSESDASSSEFSSSSDDRRKKSKRSSKRDKYKRGKRRDKRRDKNRKRHNKRSRRKSRRASDSLSSSDSESTEDSSEDDANVKNFDKKDKDDLQKYAENHSPGVDDAAIDNNLKSEGYAMFEYEESRFSKENGAPRSNGYERDARSRRSEDRQPDVVEDHPGKSRSRSASPKRVLSKSMSISPRNISRSQNLTPQRNLSRSPSVKSPPPAVQKGRSISRSPLRSVSRSPIRSISRSPMRSISRSPVRSISRSPARSLSRSPARSLSRSPRRTRPRKNDSLSPVTSPPRKSLSGSYPRGSSRKSGRSPGRFGRSSPSPVHPRRSPSPIRSSHRSLSRSSGRVRSPVRSPRRRYRRSYSRIPSIRHRSMSRSASPDWSPKRIRRGRGFSDRFSYARKYRTPSPDRYRYGVRDSYRRYSDRSPRYRSPRRSPIRYRRRSRTRSPSVSRSPPYRRRRYTRSPARSRTNSDPPRYRASPRAEKQLSNSRSRSRSASVSGSSRGSPPPKRASKDRSRSRSSSGSLPGKKGLVSYRDGSA
ncbi:unnamed protein product [Amaranthus hypochondriacus]